MVDWEFRHHHRQRDQQKIAMIDDIVNKKMADDYIKQI